jgi:hypothetical protein
VDRVIAAVFPKGIQGAVLAQQKMIRKVGEASRHPFIAEYGGSGQSVPRGVPLYRFSAEGSHRVFKSPREPEHANSNIKGGSATPWHEPC